MAHCTDCGTKMYGGTCPNCQEELYIEETQGEFIERRSDWWIETVEQQIQDKKKRLKQTRET